MQERIEPDAPRVLSVVWNLIRGGTEGQCARVAMGLARRGYIHRVAVFRKEGFFFGEVEAVCGPVFDIGIQRMFTLDTWRRIRMLAEYIRQENIDVVHLWDIDAVIFGSMAARLAGRPFITSRRDMGAIYPGHKLALMKRADRRADRMVVNAEAIADLVRTLGIKTPVEVMPNILDIDEFDRLAKKAVEFNGLPSDKFLAGMVARLDPEKDVPTFLKGIAEAIQVCPTLHGVIAGDGMERSALEDLASTLGIGQHVTFLGEVQDVPALVRQFKLGVLVPNKNEGLSNTILEYMAGGKPVIATDCGGNRELVQTGASGFVIPIGDATALARHLIDLFQHPQRIVDFGVRGRKTVEKNHTADVVISRFDKLYRAIARTP